MSCVRTVKKAIISVRKTLSFLLPSLLLSLPSCKLSLNLSSSLLSSSSPPSFTSLSLSYPILSLTSLISLTSPSFLPPLPPLFLHVPSSPLPIALTTSLYLHHFLRNTVGTKINLRKKSVTLSVFHYFSVKQNKERTITTLLK